MKLKVRARKGTFCASSILTISHLKTQLIQLCYYWTYHSHFHVMQAELQPSVFEVSSQTAPGVKLCMPSSLLPLWLRKRTTLALQQPWSTRTVMIFVSFFTVNPSYPCPFLLLFMKGSKHAFSKHDTLVIVPLLSLTFVLALSRLLG